MDLAPLRLSEFALAERGAPVYASRPQRSGPLTVLPLVMDVPASDAYAAPLSGLKLGGVRGGYGNVELHHNADGGLAIVPLHMGYIQDQAQNHCLCGSALLGAGQNRLFDDACCVQQSQGGFLQDKEQWFFILPAALRERALELRGQKGFSKLWDAIAKLNSRLGLSQVGHLEQIVTKNRAQLNRFQSRFERLEGQVGAAFFLGTRLVGLELTPTPAYFAEVWMPLVCFCYGTLAWEVERRRRANVVAPIPLPGRDVTELRSSLARERQRFADEVRGWITSAPLGNWSMQEQERYLTHRLHTLTNDGFAGQVVEDGGRIVYASLTAREKNLTAALDQAA